MKIVKNNELYIIKRNHILLPFIRHIIFFTQILDKNKSNPNQFLVCHGFGLCSLLEFIYYDLTDNVLFFILSLLWFHKRRLGWNNLWYMNVSNRVGFKFLFCLKYEEHNYQLKNQKKDKHCHLFQLCSIFLLLFNSCIK